MDRNVKCKCKSKQITNRTANKGGQNPNTLSVPQNIQVQY